MKRLKIFGVILFLSVLLTADAMATSPSLTGLTYQAGEAGASVSLMELSGGGYTLFLPSSADLSALTLSFAGRPATATVNGQHVTVTSGKPFDLLALYPTAPADGVYTLTLSRDSELLWVKIMVSRNIGSMYITSKDPVNEGRSYVEQVKGNKGSGELTLLGADGSVIYSGGLSQIKGRGNSTWSYAKKPYQIKLDKKCDLLETGDPKEAAKTWILLANYYDKSFILNTLTYDLAAALGLEYTPDGRPVDLYYDGEYLGCYLLCEKVEINSARVDIHDLELDFAYANPLVEEFDDLPTAMGTNAHGNQYQYVTGLNDPADFSGGYLLEIDYPERAAAEKSYFATSHGYYIVSKSPEYLSQNAMEYISGLYQDFEDAVFNGGINPSTGKAYTDYVDLDSLVRCYVILELSQDGDAFCSSTFFYKPEGEDKLYAGPVWDFDSAYGGYGGDTPNFAVTGLVAGVMPLGAALLSIDSFCQAVGDVYQNELDGLVTDVLLNPDPDCHSGRLRSLAGYSAEVADSQRMNNVRWAYMAGYRDLDAAVEKLRTFILQRNAYFSQLNWAGTARFLDVPGNAWYAPAVEYVADRGLFSGTGNKLFSPNEVMTRAMAITVLYNFAGKPEVADAAPFSDVEQGHWAAKPIAWAVSAGIVVPAPDALFCPTEAISRQELVTCLYRCAEYMGYDMRAAELPETFSDGNAVADWAVDAFAWAVDRGIIFGTSPTLLSPDDSGLRCMAAAIFQRYDEAVTAKQ